VTWAALDLITCWSMWIGWYVWEGNRLERRDDPGDEFDKSAELLRDPPRVEDDPPAWTGPPLPVLHRDPRDDGAVWHVGGHIGSRSCPSCKANLRRGYVLRRHRRWHEGRW
jgi:hypothetical protein